MSQTKEKKQLEDVQEYYGSVLQGTTDLKTNACCSTDAFPARLRDALANVSPVVQQRFYGCGSPIPVALDACSVLDLGCGTGRDVYIASQLVGPQGMVYGVDMTDAQISLARSVADQHMERFGYAHANVRFESGYIEDLGVLGIADNSIDVVISNCVINLSANKEQVFSEILRVLKPGGELYFSDIFADRRIPEACMEDQVLLGECLAGAMYLEDFRRLLERLGVSDMRCVATSDVEIQDQEILRKLGPTRFFSKTIRAFALDSLEDRCEDYGQFAVYRGGIEECPAAFTLDDHHCFELNRPVAVCGNTASMLSESRFGKYFEIIGTREHHFGLFDCSPAAPGGGSEQCC